GGPRPITRTLEAHGIDPTLAGPTILRAPVLMTVASVLLGDPTDPEAIIDQVLMPLIGPKSG
uniref:hypothetical protein n=1 Tax=Sedimentibacter sp. B4 TaxID=304766 RepID=UPI00058D3F17